MKYHNIPTLFDNQASLINGKNIGTDSVRYIQDAGQKTAGTTYIDKNTNELYVCVTTTNSVNNDGNFSKFNLKEAFNKLDNLLKVELREFSNSKQNTWISVDYPVGYNNVLIINCYYTEEFKHAVFTLNRDKTRFSFAQLHTDSAYGTTAAYFYFFR